MYRAQSGTPCRPISSLPPADHTQQRKLRTQSLAHLLSRAYAHLHLSSTLLALQTLVGPRPVLIPRKGLKVGSPSVTIATAMEEETQTPVIKGSFLIASPHLRDPNFRQTVVLMCEHGPGGSLGLVVNRRTEHHIMEVLPQTTGLHERAGLVYSGGPVQKDNLLILHKVGTSVPES